MALACLKLLDIKDRRTDGRRAVARPLAHDATDIMALKRLIPWLAYLDTLLCTIQRGALIGTEVAAR